MCGAGPRGCSVRVRCARGRPRKTGPAAAAHNLYGRLPCGKRVLEVLTRRVHCGLISGLCSCRPRSAAGPDGHSRSRILISLAGWPEGRPELCPDFPTHGLTASPSLPLLACALLGLLARSVAHRRSQRAFLPAKRYSVFMLLPLAAVGRMLAQRRMWHRVRRSTKQCAPACGPPRSPPR